MCKSEIFAETINLVAQETEIPASRILSSDKDTETVDARYLLVQLLVERGMYPSQIAPKIHKTKRAINYMISNFQERMEGGKMLRIYWENIRKALGNNWFHGSIGIYTLLSLNLSIALISLIMRWINSQTNVIPIAIPSAVYCSTALSIALSAKLIGTILPFSSCL